jgi:5-oxopent-3-ene-1,2,5-tricarboxylate decarboxylase/2-hydroxyhepta-2,4-diene-1,7-dioate isomerase
MPRAVRGLIATRSASPMAASSTKVRSSGCRHSRSARSSRSASTTPTASALIGHRGETRRPADVSFMHYECELAVVIGRTAKRVAKANAMQHVAGYTVANDYAIRDYLENWYRPNLRVKNRDGGTVLGPWLVDAADVGDAPALALRTLVNGKVTQQGNTRDLVFDIPTLIEYLSGFMTLQAGDVILTGTPEGVVDVRPGDEVVCEIDGIGRLVNRIVGDEVFGRA